MTTKRDHTYIREEGIGGVYLGRGSPLCSDQACHVLPRQRDSSQLTSHTATLPGPTSPQRTLGVVIIGAILAAARWYIPYSCPLSISGAI